MEQQRVLVAGAEPRDWEVLAKDVKPTLVVIPRAATFNLVRG